MVDVWPHFYKKLILLTKRSECCKYHRKLLTVVFEHYIWIHLPIFLKILISIVEYARFKVSCLFCVPATGKLCTDARVCLHHTIVYIILYCIEVKLGQSVEAWASKTFLGMLQHYSIHATVYKKSLPPADASTDWPSFTSTYNRVWSEEVRQGRKVIN